MAKITHLFAENEISLQEILQLPDQDETRAQLIIITHVTSKAKMNSLLIGIKQLDVVDEVNSVYPVEEGE
jgi:homoserine dehydrogenase